MERQRIYSITELAALGGISRFKMRRLLDARGVPRTRVGRKDWVLVIDLKEAWPRLWATLVECQAVRPLVRR